MGYNVILIKEKYNPVILGVKVAEGKDHQPKPCYFLYGSFVYISVAIR